MIERFLFIIFDRIGNLNLQQVVLLFFLHMVTGYDLSLAIFHGYQQFSVGL